VQRAPFSPSALAARRLVRQQQRRYAVEQIDRQLLGLLKTREALLHHDPTGRDLSVALRDVLRALEQEVQRRGEDFGEPPGYDDVTMGCQWVWWARCYFSVRYSSGLNARWSRHGYVSWTRRSTPKG
jgi:hypothetical protein